MNVKELTLVSLAWLLGSQAIAQKRYDVCIYGGTAAGVIAAVSVKKLGRSVILIEPGRHLGGLSAGGLGYTDIGNKYVVTGLAKDFYRRVGQHYGKFEQWIFEPHVAEQIFNDYIRTANIPVLFSAPLVSVTKHADRITSMRAGKQLITAKEFIDCSYEGDLMARASVSYTVGREDNSQYGETYNGVQLLGGHQFPDGIDPYRIKGDPQSGLLWGISRGQLAKQGSGDTRVQSYNYRICLTDDPANRIAITKPVHYDSSHYELLVRLMAAQPAKQSLNDYFIWSAMPNHKTDINNRNGFSTDMIGTNDQYPNGSAAQREAYVNALKDYTQGLLYFVGHDPRVPLALRQQILDWGYPKDEYVQDDHWSFQPYIREARRMVGAYVMTQANCTGKERVTDGIAQAAYTMDSHNCERLVVNGIVKNEGNVEIGGFPPYPIAYRALLPKANECSNLIVPVCLSASHIAYGSIRMEPVFMVLAQVAGTAACLAINQSRTVQAVDYRSINRLLANDPEQIIDNEAAVVKGEAKLKTGEAYGPDMLLIGKNTKVRFYPHKGTAGTHQLYTYYPVLAGGADTTDVEIFDGRHHYERRLIRSQIRVEGQTSGEWLPLGSYRLSAGAYIQLSTGGPGVTAADAVLFKPYKK